MECGTIEKQRCCGKQPVHNLVIQSLGIFQAENTQVR